MLGSIGAESSQIKTGLLSHGFAVGAVSAVIGTLAGVALAAVAVPNIESVVDRRIDFALRPLAIVPPGQYKISSGCSAL